VAGASEGLAAFPVVERGELLLTANRRLATHLRARLDAGEREAGRAAWRSPDVLPLGAWVERAWLADWPEEALLSDHQAETAWEGVVRGRPHGTDLIDLRLLVRRAVEAHRLCREWDVPLSPGEPFLSREARVFLDWREGYLSACRAHRWVDRPEALERLVARIADGAVAPPGTVRLAGFDRVPPQLERLLAAMRSRGAEVGPWEAPRFPAARARRVEAADPDDEALMAARWSRALLERGEPGPIGIVCPHLEEVRVPLSRALRDQLAPGAVRDLEGAPVNVSLGAPLARTPGAAAALGLLAVGEGPVDTVALCALLRSDALAGAGDERGARARLAARLSERAGPRLTLGRVRAELAADGGALPGLADLLGRWAGAVARQRGPRRPSAWARAFATLLADLGWPGADPGSAMWQAAHKFREVLGSLSALDGVVPSLERHEAVGRLERLARETTYQPEGPETAVQVMGTLEAAGLGFTHLWVMGMADTVWPPPPAPNPFIPFVLQRARDVPGATAEGQLAHARRITDRLLAAAPDVVVSHPRQVEDRQLSPSPLVAHLPEAGDGVEAAPDRRYVWAVHRARPSLEAVADPDGPPLGPQERARGGAALFADQAACPFRAFALRRLDAAPVEEPHAGLDPRERGTLAHRMMAAVWTELGDAAGLAALGEAALSERLAALAREVVERAFARRPPAPGLAALEAERLARMAVDWLAVERERAPFSVALAEEAVEVEVGGVAVDLRVDRVDRLADGGLALIDYKTGATAPADWFGDRPTAPQLPLYAIALDRPPVAVAYARLKRGDMGFDGVWDPDGAALPGRPLAPEKRAGSDGSWPGMLAAWRRVLADLGEHFRAGHAPVDPKDDDACRHCPLPPLCRIDERREALGNDD
jgi:ATP-dependent helicase/nuclease subunit B